MKKINLRVAVVALLALFAMTMATTVATASTNKTGNGVVTVASGPGSLAQPGDLMRLNAVTPAIQQQSCTSARVQWFHLRTTAGTWCYGFTGTISIPRNTTLAWCWGNNFGTLYLDANGNAYALTITGWSGNARC